MEDLIKRIWRWIVEMDDKYGCFSDPEPYPPPQKPKKSAHKRG